MDAIRLPAKDGIAWGWTSKSETAARWPGLNNKTNAAAAATSSRLRISADDVLLVARKNPAGLLDKLHAFCEKHCHDNTVTTGKAAAKKKAAPKAAPVELPESTEPPW